MESKSVEVLFFLFNCHERAPFVLINALTIHLLVLYFLFCASDYLIQKLCFCLTNEEYNNTALLDKKGELQLSNNAKSCIGKLYMYGK